MDVRISSRGRLMAKAVTGAVLVALLGFGATPAAQALVTVSRSETATGVHGETVRCPSGTHVVSGGGFTSLGFVIHTKKDRNGWEIFADPGPGGGSSTIVVFANCGQRNYHLDGVRRSRSVPSGGVMRTASCPPGQNLVSGGGGVGPVGYLFRQRKVGDGWSTGADSAGFGFTTVTSWAYCTPRGLNLVRASRSSTSSSNQDVTAECPGRTKLVSGGGSIDTVGFMWGSRKLQNGWRFYGDPNGAGSATVTADAYCR
jgi:hypothetical protein